MNWYEIYHNTSTGIWDVYKVTGNGQRYEHFKALKTEAGAKNFAKKHWVKNWVEI